jgi:hypothetical protein
VDVPAGDRTIKRHIDPFVDRAIETKQNFRRLFCGGVQEGFPPENAKIIDNAAHWREFVFREL